IQILKLGREPESVEESEDQDGNFGVGLEAKKFLESADIVERFIDDGKPDDRVDNVRIRVDVAEYAGEQRDAVADGEQADVQDDVFHPVEKENHADQE